MMLQDLLIFVLPALTALFFLVMGIRGLTGRKPIVLPSWVGSVFIALLLSSALWAIEDAVRPTVSKVVLLGGGLWLAILARFWWTTRAGIVFYGVTERPFRNAYRQALDDLGVPADEWPTELTIPNRGLTIQMKVNSRSAVATLTSRPVSGLPFLRQLSQRIRDDYSDDGTLRERLPHFVDIGLLLVLTLCTIAVGIFW